MTAVRRRLIKAVFFFMDESREPCTGKMSGKKVSKVFGIVRGLGTLLAVPCSNIQLTKLSYDNKYMRCSRLEANVRFLCLSMVEEAMPQLWRGGG